MAFVDIKCLESLLIEGEEMIATEGIGSTISGIAKRVFGMIVSFIGTIINIFRGIVNKLRGKKPKKLSHDELKAMGVATFKPASTKVATFKPASTKLEYTGLKNSERFGVISETALNALRSLVLTICTSFLTVSNNLGSNDISDEVSSKLNNTYKESSEDLDDYISKYNGSHNIITNKAKEAIIEALNANIETLDKHQRRANNLAEKGMEDLLKNEKECLNMIIKIIPKAQNYATKMAGIINNCEISE